VASKLTPHDRSGDIANPLTQPLGETLNQRRHLALLALLAHGRGGRLELIPSRDCRDLSQQVIDDQKIQHVGDGAREQHRQPHPLIGRRARV
jgi:hypothetical protein